MAAPDPRQLEVSVFGPGIGECIVVHVGGGKWLVVDSCENSKTRSPVALEYLRSIGVNVGSDVILFAVTHWHDDHVKGAAEFYRECKSAEFWCSRVLKSKEFWVLTQQSREWKLVQLSSALDEFRLIFDELKERSSAPNFGAANQRLLKTVIADMAVEVWSLSPSSASELLALQEIAGELAGEGDRPKRPVSINANHASMALWIRVGEACVVLGADLQVTATDDRGWMAVVESGARPHDKAVVYKVAHHGSANGDHDRIWSDLLVDQPTAVLSPMRLGSNDLPRPEDIERLAERTPSLYCTAAINATRSIRRRGAVERTIRETARRLETIEGGTGQVRIRIDMETSSTTVELLAGATELS